MRAAALLLLAALAAPVADPAAPRIEDFSPARGAVPPGEEAVSSLTLRGAAAGARTVWVGYSVRDPEGRWHDVPAHPVRLPAGARSAPQAKGWRVPAEAPGGFYRVAMAVWSAPPGSPGAARLASADREDAFRVAPARDPGDRLDTAAWARGEHPLGRGGVAAAHVRALDGGLALVLPGGRHAGAELRSRERLGHGTYAARLRTPRAPGSLTAFFLYEDDPAGSDEIDIEILNDGSRRVLLTAWIGGERTHHAEAVLPFDPAAGFHEYAIEHRPGSLALLADGVPIRRWEGRLPTRPMHLLLNAWWPTWLEGAPPPADREARVERVTW